MVSTGALAGRWRSRHVTDAIGRRNSTDQQDAPARPSLSGRRRYWSGMLLRSPSLLAAGCRSGTSRGICQPAPFPGSAVAPLWVCWRTFSSAWAQASIGSTSHLAQTFVSRVAQGRKAVHYMADHVIAAAHCHAFEGVAHPVTVRVVRSAFGDMSGTGTRTIHPGSEQALGGGPVFAVARHGFSRVERHRRRQPAKRGKSTLFSRCICSTRSSENFFALV